MEAVLDFFHGVAYRMMGKLTLAVLLVVPILIFIGRIALKERAPRRGSKE